MTESQLIEVDQRAIVAQPATPSAMLMLAVQRGDSMEQIKQLMDLQDRWEATEARKACVLALTQFKAEPLTILKRKAVGYNTKEGDFVGYKHAELSDVTSVVVPAMARHGLSHRWNVEQRDGKVIVTCVVMHARGHSESVTMEAPPDSSGKKNSIQAIASTVSYLQRYTLLAMTGMATTGQDDDGAGGIDAEEKAKQEKMAARGLELEELALAVIEAFVSGRELEAVAIWQNPANWAKDQEEANEERKWTWDKFTSTKKLKAFLKANDERANAQ